ncbi:MAG: 4Fe-4S cluster-binding domain-containing protein, partial [Gammaproteobacteria bacterium]|nr:4Fe-4S cluster-binding domain-containing protein [Gammaproteobacteria bacterium]
MQQLADAVTDTHDLLARLSLDPAGVDHDPSFPLRVPLSFVARMRTADPTDPLLRQVLPSLAERDDGTWFQCRPARPEAAATRAPGLIHKYAHRALLIAAPACAVHCRYCFRRDFPYDEHATGAAFPALLEVERDTTLTEIILSGGDPLMLKDRVLGRLVARLD